MTVTIQPLESHGYAAFASACANAWPFWPAESASELEREDAKREAHVRWARFLARDGDRVVGASDYRHRSYAFHPQEFAFNVAVLPEFEHAGLRDALFDHLLLALEPFQPRALFTWVNEVSAREQEFYARRGFAEVSRSFESRLDVAGFNLAPWGALEARVREAGYAITTLKALESDPDHRRKFFDLHVALDTDVPLESAYTPPSFEEFVKHHFDDPTFDPEAVSIAVLPGEAGLEYVAMNELWPPESGGPWRNGLTGAARDHRRLGLATAVKLHGIRYARSQGAGQISTFNASANAGMLAVNESLGFARQPVNIELRKALSSETPQETA